MIRTVSLLALLAVLGACGDGQPIYPGDNPTDPTDPTDPEVALLPDAIAGNLTNAQYVAPTDDNPNGSLLVQIQSLDSTPTEVEYARNASLDLLNDDGSVAYQAYSVQEDPLDRFFIGLARESADGAIRGAVVADGGQFNRYFGGVDIQRGAEYSAYQPSQPDRGLVSYAGEYAGLLNVGTDASGGQDPDLASGKPVRVTGEVFINADFTDNAVNGAIVGRETVEGGFQLAPVALIPTDITEDGTFSGDVEPSGAVGQSIGTYGGAFGGTGATSVAGGLYLQDHIDEIPDVDNVEERGLFVLNRCGEDGEDPICAIVDPQD